MAVVLGIVLAAGIAALTVTWRHSRHPTVLPHASCGSATTHGLAGHTQILSADPGALSCFGTAARECRAASIEVTESGVDTGTRHVFTIDQAATTCQASQLSQPYSANGGGRTDPVQTTRCDHITVTSRGVTLTCNGQDLLIPLTVSPGPRIR